MTSHRARPQPISRGNSAAWMTLGMPTLTSGMPNLASCAGSGSRRRREFEAATEAPAGHPRDHRLGKRPHRLAEIAQAGNECFRGGLIELGHFLDIGAADHALSLCRRITSTLVCGSAASASKPFGGRR